MPGESGAWWTYSGSTGGLRASASIRLCIRPPRHLPETFEFLARRPGLSIKHGGTGQQARLPD